jgi:transcription termination factor Rho
MLLTKEELEKVWAIRKNMTDSYDFIEAFLKKLAETKSNREFLDQLDVSSAASITAKKVKNSAS